MLTIKGILSEEVAAKIASHLAINGMVVSANRCGIEWTISASFEDVNEEIEAMIEKATSSVN